jgi:hypothetical protein
MQFKILHNFDCRGFRFLKLRNTTSDTYLVFFERGVINYLKIYKISKQVDERKMMK